jgi:hypothetical protein
LISRHSITHLSVELRTAALIVFGGLIAGFGLGKVDINRIVHYTEQAYVNRYLSMSGENRQHITYYVYAEDAALVLPAITEVPGVADVKAAGPERLFDVIIDYTKRREVIRELRAMPAVSAVFTVPLMCH